MPGRGWRVPCLERGWADGRPWLGEKSAFYNTREPYGDRQCDFVFDVDFFFNKSHQNSVVSLSEISCPPQLLCEEITNNFGIVLIH